MLNQNGSHKDREEKWFMLPLFSSGSMTGSALYENISFNNFSSAKKTCGKK